MKIAVCEDDANYRKKLVAQIKRCIKMDIPIDEYDDGDSLLETYREGMRYNILFLDIQMPGVWGTEAAAEIKRIDINALFVFITCLPDHMGNAIDVRASGYVMKTMDVEKLELGPVIDRCMLEWMESSRKIPMPSDTGMIEVAIRDIEFVESEKRNVLLHFRSGNTIRINLKLKEILSQLQTFDFERCHKGYIINLWAIHGCKDNMLITKSGSKVPISRRNEKRLWQAFGMIITGV